MGRGGEGPGSRDGKIRIRTGGNGISRMCAEPGPRPHSRALKAGSICVSGRREALLGAAAAGCDPAGTRRWPMGASFWNHACRPTTGGGWRVRGERWMENGEWWADRSVDRAMGPTVSVSAAGDGSDCVRQRCGRCAPPRPPPRPNGNVCPARAHPAHAAPAPLRARWGCGEAEAAGALGLREGYACPGGGGQRAEAPGVVGVALGRRGVIALDCRRCRRHGCSDGSSVGGRYLSAYLTICGSEGAGILSGHTSPEVLPTPASAGRPRGVPALHPPPPSCAERAGCWPWAPPPPPPPRRRRRRPELRSSNVAGVADVAKIVEVVCVTDVAGFWERLPCVRGRGGAGGAAQVSLEYR
eukprot:gene16037-biopygen7571